MSKPFFDGCKHWKCKCAAAGMVCMCAYAFGAEHPEYCGIGPQQSPFYLTLCKAMLSWDIVHGQHNEPRSENEMTMTTSTASNTTSVTSSFTLGTLKINLS